MFASYFFHTILYKPIFYFVKLAACRLKLEACGLCRNWSHAKRRAQPSNTNRTSLFTQSITCIEALID